jgi:hypothetical protein
MSEWGVFGVIAALVAFGVAVGTPLMKLNSSISPLNCSASQLAASLITAAHLRSSSMVEAISLILRIRFLSFLRFALCGEQAQLSCQPQGYNADRGENFNELLVHSTVLGFYLCLIHLFHLQPESVLFLLSLLAGHE